MSSLGTRSVGTVAPNPWGAQFWLTRAAHGFIAGTTIATLDFLYYFPLVSAPNEIGFGSYVASLVLWCGECILFALTLGLAERLASPGELRAWQLGLALVGSVSASVITWHGFSVLVLRDQLGLRLFRDNVGQPENLMGGMFYHAWLILFFGGLIAAVGAAQRRRTRMAAALRSAELNRATSQQRLAQTRLASIEATIDPDYLYHTLSQLERLYDEDPPAADQLLDELIAFLRNGLTEAHAFKLKEAL